MWGPEIHSKVMDQLHLKQWVIGEDDIGIMPYEDVQLDDKPGSNY